MFGFHFQIAALKALHSSDPPGVEVYFNYLPQKGQGNLKNQNKGWKYGVGAVVLKGGAGTFPIKFFQGLSFLYLEITLPFAKLCYAFEEKKIFSATIVL